MNKHWQQMIGGLFVIAVLLLLLHVFGFFRQTPASKERSKEERVASLIKPHPMDGDGHTDTSRFYNRPGGQSSRFLRRRHLRHCRRR